MIVNYFKLQAWLFDTVGVPNLPVPRVYYSGWNRSISLQWISYERGDMFDITFYGSSIKFYDRHRFFTLSPKEWGQKIQECLPYLDANNTHAKDLHVVLQILL